jgi:hypothetical protein
MREGEDACREGVLSARGHPLSRKSQGGPGTQRGAALIPVQIELHKQGYDAPGLEIPQSGAILEMVPGKHREN